MHHSCGLPLQNPHQSRTKAKNVMTYQQVIRHRYQKDHHVLYDLADKYKAHTVFMYQTNFFKNGVLVVWRFATETTGRNRYTHTHKHIGRNNFVSPGFNPLSSPFVFLMANLTCRCKLCGVRRLEFFLPYWPHFNSYQDDKKNIHRIEIWTVWHTHRFWICLGSMPVKKCHL